MDGPRDGLKTQTVLLRWILVVVAAGVLLTIARAIVDSRTKTALDMQFEDMRALIRYQDRMIEIQNTEISFIRRRSDDQQKRNELENDWFLLVSDALGVRLKGLPKDTNHARPITNR